MADPQEQREWMVERQIRRRGIESAAILAAAPAAAPAKAAGADFAAAMAAMGNPKVTGIEASAGGGDDEAALAAQILALK